MSANATTAVDYEDVAARLSAIADRLDEIFPGLDDSTDRAGRSAGNDVDNARVALRRAVDKLDAI